MAIIPNSSEKAAGTGVPITFLNRADRILIGFLNAFFAQPQLFVSGVRHSASEPGEARKSVVVQITEDRAKESVDAVPAVVLQDMGFEERQIGIDSRHTHLFGEALVHKSHFAMNYNIHCIARFRGSAKTLQALVTLALVMFRRALYDNGVDYIGPIRGMPPVKMSPSNSDAGPYSGVISFELLHALDWEEVWGDELEEKISMAIETALECATGSFDLEFEVDVEQNEES